MPLPSSRKGESKKEFISRCMSDEESNKTFSDQKQRIAVCFKRWADKKSKASLVAYMDDGTIGGDEMIWVNEEVDESFAALEAEIESTTLAADKAPYGDVHYCDMGMQPDGKKRFPCDTETHIRAAWSYSHHKNVTSKYTSSQLSKLHACIERAWKDKIDPAGPPSA